MISEETIKNYMEKVQLIEAERDRMSSNHFMQSKIEAHLEMLCLLGMTEMLDKMVKKK